MDTVYDPVQSGGVVARAGGMLVEVVPDCFEDWVASGLVHG